MVMGQNFTSLLAPEGRPPGFAVWSHLWPVLVKGLMPYPIGTEPGGGPVGWKFCRAPLLNLLSISGPKASGLLEKNC